MDTPDPQIELKEIMHALNGEFQKRCNYMSLHQLRSAADAFRAFSSGISLVFSSRINSMVPISTLPDDVLLHMFKVATKCRVNGVSFSMAEQSHSSDSLAIHTLILITHVCARWRAVALASPNLWTRIHFRSNEILEAFTQRAQQLPISLCVNVDEEEKDGHATFCERIKTLSGFYASRIRRLDIVDYFSLQPTNSSPPTWLEGSNFTTLESLNLSIVLGPPLDFSRTTRSYFILGQTSLPLKSLAITGMGTWVPANYLPRLTHLFLSFGNSRWVEISGIFLIFERSPCLEFVHLACISTKPDAAEVTKHAVLKNLKLFALSTCDIDVLRIINNIRIPSTAIIRATGMDFHAEIPFPPTRIDALHTSVRDIHIYVPTGCAAASIFVRGVSCNFAVQGHETQNGLASDWVGDCLHMLGSSNGYFLKDITELILDVSALPTRVIAGLLPHTPHLSILRAWVSSRQLPSPPTAQEPAWDVVDNLRILCGALKIWCPVLRVLVLAPAAPFPLTSSKGMSLDIFGAMTSALEDMLIQRAANGCDPLEELVLTRVEDMGKEADVEGISGWPGLARLTFGRLEKYVKSLAVLGPDSTGENMQTLGEWYLEDEEAYWELREEYSADNLFEL